MIMWYTFLYAMGLVFVFEGILPFLSPRLWRKTMHKMFIQPDRTMRLLGLISMLLGLTIVSLLHMYT